MSSFYFFCSYYLLFSNWICLLGVVFLVLYTWICHGSKFFLYNVQVYSGSNKLRILALALGRTDEFLFFFNFYISYYIYIYIYVCIYIYIYIYIYICIHIYIYTFRGVARPLQTKHLKGSSYYNSKLFRYFR